MCLFGQDGRVVTWTPGEVLFINKQKSPPVQLLSYPLLRINKKTFWRREQDIWNGHLGLRETVIGIFSDFID